MKTYFQQRMAQNIISQKGKNMVTVRKYWSKLGVKPRMINTKWYSSKSGITGFRSLFFCLKYTSFFWACSATCIQLSLANISWLWYLQQVGVSITTQTSLSQLCTMAFEILLPRILVPPCLIWP